MEEKKNGEVKDEVLDKVAGGAGGAPKPTAPPEYEQKKKGNVSLGKRP